MASLLFFYVCLLVNSTKTHLFVLIHLPRMNYALSKVSTIYFIPLLQPGGIQVPPPRIVWGFVGPGGRCGSA